MIDNRKTGRYIALFFLGLTLFNYPILSLFNLNGTVLGIPTLYLYIFLTWGLMIAVIMLITRTGDGAARPVD